MRAGSRTGPGDRFAEVKRPVVIWNITRRCNLHCLHCYSASKDQEYSGELTTEEGATLINSLASYGVPVIIFSGGDPLLRLDLFDLAQQARDRGIHCALSTNGTLIDRTVAKKLREAGFSYVGVSLDGIGEGHDRFRGMQGAFERALTGLRRCRDEGIRAGVRTVLCRRTLLNLPAIFNLVEVERVERLYLSHLVYSGRGARLVQEDLPLEAKREMVDYIFDRAVDFHRRDLKVEIATGNNDADGVYLYLKLKREQPEKARVIYRLLKRRGGNSSGTSLANIDSFGHVHADPFWSDYSFGNVRERSFGTIWEDTSNPVMRGLRDRKGVLKGRCARCSFLEICGGSSRVRAKAITGSIWGSDPACYLNDEELGTSLDNTDGSHEAVLD